MDRTRHLVALVCLAVSCVFVMLAILADRPGGAVAAGTVLVAISAAATWRTRPGPGGA